ncbi:hypothetical protein HDU99_008355, partial [Rhizoclosmatium hyalinum]
MAVGEMSRQGTMKASGSSSGVRTPAFELSSGVQPLQVHATPFDDEDEVGSGFLTAPESQRSRSKRGLVADGLSESENDGYYTARSALSSVRSGASGTDG